MRIMRHLRAWGLCLVALLLAAQGVFVPTRLAMQSPAQLREGTWYPDPSKVDRNYDLLRQALGNQAVIGYAGSGPITSGADNPFNAATYYAAQYALAPILLDPNPGHPLVLMNMPNAPSDDLRHWVATSRAQVLRVIDRGRALVRIPPR